MTNMTQAVETVVKTDATGRILTTPARREVLLSEFDHSGLSAVKFAQLAGIKYQTFAGWVARRRKQRTSAAVPAAPPGAVDWLEAVVGEKTYPVGGAQGSLKLHLPSGAWIEIEDLKHVPLAVALFQALHPRGQPC